MARQDVVDAAEPLLLSRDLADAEAALEHATMEVHRLKANWAKGDKPDEEALGMPALLADRSFRQRDQTIRRMRALRLPVHSDYDYEQEVE